MPIQTLRIATRKSPLALWQAEHVRLTLRQHWPDLNIELVPMTTSGDQFLKDSLLKIGGKGLFVKELEDALLHHRADIAVHSMKDVPTHFPQGLCLAAICSRDSPFDALVCETYTSIDTLAYGASVGTTSLRRQSQLLAIRPDLKMLPLRGNIQTRLAKMQSGEYDAIVLAQAGLQRMGLDTMISETIPCELMLPACGQGALGIECRTDDEEIHQFITPLNDSLTALCVHSERHVNALLGGNCHVPLAVYCKPMPNSELLLRAMVATPDGQTRLTAQQSGPDVQAMELAEQCAQDLLARGARALLAAS